MTELQAECLSKVLPYMGMKWEEVNQDKDGVFRTRGRLRQRTGLRVKISHNVMVVNLSNLIQGGP